MAVTIDWSTKVISVPQADLTLISGALYEHDVDAFWKELAELEASAAGIPEDIIFVRNDFYVLSGVIYAQAINIINGYTVTYEETGSAYRVRLAGANNNILDVATINNVSIAPQNSAGLIANPTTDSAADEIIDNIWAAS